MKSSPETGKRSKGDDNSNKILLPVKMKGKTKGTKQSKKKEVQCLSKSQKRKLKQLEEEKKRKALELKSIETIEKYKIHDDAYSLLHSSGNMGQVETLREKRLRTMYLSKVGLEVPEDVLPFKKVNQGASYESEACTEPDYGKNCSKQDCEDGNVLKLMITNVDHAGLSGTSGNYPKPSFGGVPNKDNQSERTLSNADVQGDQRNLTIVPCIKDKAKCNKDMENDVSRTECQNISTAANLAVQQSVNVGTSCLLVEKDREKDGSKSNSLNASAVASQAEQKLVNGRTVVHVSRPKEVEDKRGDLPIVMMEQEIMEAINEHPAVIICGETGCGKTTQVPQFLYEAGFGSSNCNDGRGIIGVTQPRRVAVLATAKRVAFELGFCLGKEVGFQVRHDKKIGENCSIKFMTDGILLREVQNDFLLKRYSIVILDEAHERSLSTDILIGMLSRVLQVRQKLHAEQQEKLISGVKISPENLITPLKLVLMSATLRVEDFVSDRKLFHDPPPIIEVPTRQYPVTVHFSKKTEIVDYIGEAYKKVMLIHKKLPSGGILVFVTGQQEVEYLCRKLQKTSQQLTENSFKGHIGNEIKLLPEVGNIEQGSDMKDISEAFEIRGDSPDQESGRFSSHYGDLDDFEDFLTNESVSESELLDESDDDEDSLSNETSDKSDLLVDILREPGSIASLRAAFEALAGNTPVAIQKEKPCLPDVPPRDESSDHPSASGGKHGNNGTHAGPLHVLPLYAMLPAAAQLRVFLEVPEGERLVVVATNVAETSLTIPGIKYVVDTGREKVKNYNYSNGMAMYEVQWISKASAAQRAGRAGRTGPGHCYRLYSSAVFSNIFSDFSNAEITRIPVDGVVLVMKSMGIDKVVNFPFPTAPDKTAMVEAERCLKALEALDSLGRLTPIGKAMAQYPMSPRHSRMLLTVVKIMQTQQGYARTSLVLAYAVAAAAALSVSNPFIRQSGASNGDKDDLDHDGEQGGIDSEKDLDQVEKLRRKKLKSMAKAARAKFSNPSSDALTVAYALQLFELAEDPVEFCKNNALHLKTMDEMSKLRKQLLELIFHQNAVKGMECEFSWTQGTLDDVECAWRISSDRHPLRLYEEDILGQAVCAGWADRVAKRVRMVSDSSDKDRKANAVRYQACMVMETVFLHRSSAVCQSVPEFAVYNELLQTKRPYMHGVTSVKPDWLVRHARSLCCFSAPLTDPKPYYDPFMDQLMCWVTPTFGPHLWQLPLHSMPIKNDVLRVSVFAYALLEGNVLPCLKSVRKFMAAPPSSILRPEASGQKRVGNLLSKLKIGSKMIDSRSTLRGAWDKNPMELHSEIRCWFQERFQHKFEDVWVQMHWEVLLEPKELFPKRVKKEKQKEMLLLPQHN